MICRGIGVVDREEDPLCERIAVAEELANEHLVDDGHGRCVGAVGVA